MVAGADTTRNQIQLWRTDGGRLINSLGGQHTKPVVLVKFSADEKSLLSADQNGTVVVWQIDDGKVLNKLTKANQQIMEVSADQTILVLWTPEDGSIQLWSLPQNRVQLELRDRYKDLSAAALSPNGNILALGSSDGTIRFWDVGEGSFKGSIAGVKEAGKVGSLLFMPDAETVVAGFDDGSIRFWQLSDRRPLLSLKHDKAVGSLCVSANGKLLVSEGDDGTIRSWRIGKAAE
jgi:WD40 repeat protein